jgi:hypothetical protein
MNKSRPFEDADLWQLEACAFRGSLKALFGAAGGGFHTFTFVVML